MAEENSQKVLTKTAYEHLVVAVGKMLEEGKKAGQQADSSLAKIYWTIGDKLKEAGLIGRDHYGESVIEQLAEDLEINAQTIRRAVVFRRVYDDKNLSRSVKFLTWSHYRLLVEIRDDDARLYYEEKAASQGWSRDRMKTAIVSREYEREVKKEEGADILKRPTDAGYVFRVTVLDVVDSDTLLLAVDCGFKITKEERIRLAGLNAPELETKKGKEAALHVRDQLTKAKGIVVKTEKVDTFGRFVGHIFYSFEDDEVGKVYAEGRYLNDELLKKGMAHRM
jgi:endonuclease YncB( thermonuclease family)